MKKIEITSDIKVKHMKFIVDRNTKGKLNEFKLSKEEEGYFNKKYNKFMDEHNRFIKFLEDQVDIIIKEKYDYIKCKDNIFICSPKKLNYYIDYVKENFPNLDCIFNINNGYEAEYSSKIINILGYNDFVGSYEFSKYVDIDYLFEELGQKNKINKRLKDNKINKSIIRYESKDYENIKKYILDKLNKINDKSIYDIKKSINMIDTSRVNKIEFVNLIYGYINKLKKINGEIESIDIEKYNMKNYPDEFWGAYSYVFELGLKVCPYCNRQYITPIFTHRSKLRGDIDHFFSKARYPYLSNSICNLIPSCKFCNTSLKGDIDFNYNEFLHPFEMGVSEVLEFDFVPKSYESFYGKDEIDIILKEKAGCEKRYISKAYKNCEVFEIENLYKYHSDIVKNILLKKLIYSDKYLDKLLEKYGNIFSSRKELINILLSQYLEIDNLDKPLAMLIRDIISRLY